MSWWVLKILVQWRIADTAYFVDALLCQMQPINHRQFIVMNQQRILINNGEPGSLVQCLGQVPLARLIQWLPFLSLQLKQQQAKQH